MFTKLNIPHLSIVLALMITMIFAACLQAASSQIKPSYSQKNEMLQFTNSGHALGFQSNSVYVASGSHMLRENFIGAKRAIFQTDQEVTEDGQAQSMSTVSYPELWEGITLIYDSPPGGILRSTYHIKPKADPGKITLCYNVPAHLDISGNLIFELKTGTMTASAPIAWQTINGERVKVDVAFLLDNLQSTVSFSLGNYNSAFPLTIDPTLTWHTFMGSTSNDYGNAIAVDDTGNIFVAGSSGATWGSSPVKAHAGAGDAFVAKLNSSGELQWNTFMGSTGSDEGLGIAVDGAGSVYVVGNSNATWGSSPVNAYAGNYEVFAAKLNTSGVRLWHTFMGSAGYDYASAIAVDGSSNVYVAGSSNATWGSLPDPVNAHAGGDDAFAVKLNTSGVRLWNTFMGSTDSDGSSGIAVDSKGNVYLGGSSEDTWGTPVSAFVSAYGSDVFVARLSNSGSLQWNTFMGSYAVDYAKTIALDSIGNVYITGFCNKTWGSPINPHAGGDLYDAIAAKLNTSGVLQWHTFMGSTDVDRGRGIAVDKRKNVYVTGYSQTDWGGCPLIAYEGGDEAFVVKILQGSLTPVIPLLLLQD